MGVLLTHNNKSRYFLRRTSVASLTTVLLLGATHAAFAVPTAVDPAQVEKRFERPQTPLPTTPLENVKPVDRPAIPNSAQAELAKKRFVLRKVNIEGNTVFSDDQLKFAYDGRLGKEISLLDAQTIVGRITEYYRNHDYILSQAVVPPQGIKDGVLNVRVIEGYIANVVVQGDVRESGSSRRLIESYAEHIKANRPIRTADLERYLLLIDDLPGATAKGLVRPSAKTFGAADLVINVTHKKYEGSYTLDNRGTKFVGPWQHSAIATANSALGLYDRTLLRIVTTSPTSELRFVDIQHEEQLGNEGTRLVLDLSHSLTHPGDTLKPLDLRGESTAFETKLLHPFIRSRKENLVARALFNYRNTDTDVFDTTNLTTDRLRVLRAGGSYDFADGLLGVNLIDAQVSQGINVFNATKKGDLSTNPNTDATFTKVNLDLARTQPLPRNFSLYTAATGQYAFEKLLAAEQFSLGGAGFGQAYDPAELSGDNGVAGKVELRYGQALNDQYVQSYQVYSFYDIGRVWLRQAGPGGNDKLSLASAGFGLRTNFSQNLSANLEVGDPLTKKVNNQGDHGSKPRIFFSMTGRF